MVIHRRLTEIMEREGDGYVALCPELDIAGTACRRLGIT